jgi:hypothetical protein
VLGGSEESPWAKTRVRCGLEALRAAEASRREAGMGAGPGGRLVREATDDLRGVDDMV